MSRVRSTVTSVGSPLLPGFCLPGFCLPGFYRNLGFSVLYIFFNRVFALRKDRRCLLVTFQNRFGSCRVLVGRVFHTTSSSPRLTPAMDRFSNRFRVRFNPTLYSGCIHLTRLVPAVAPGIDKPPNPKRIRMNAIQTLATRWQYFVAKRLTAQWQC